MDTQHLMYAGPLISLALLWAVAVVTPGPNFFTTAQLAAGNSRKHGVACALGVATGTVLWGLAGGLGIKSLFTAAPALYLILKIAGGAYLVYLGVKLFLRRQPTVAGQQPTLGEPRRSLGYAYMRGLLGNMTNPKSALFVATIFATTMPSSPPAPLLAMAVATMASLSFCWYCSVALVFASTRMSAFYSRCRKGLDRFAGTCYLLFGAHLMANR
ncbi:LysE family transporter [Pseudomonas gingeri]|uniref:LysE family transporter n=1 Tax=Pseudomonas TaxID=286 RepID=UPI0015A47A92|nr:MULTISPECIES: LysE family transporter [Pseudomonas]NVZ24820.1 LysE family transporter [Pseudomonas gingeri]NVZ66881.1 LysE family transporter [Pseudomonas gingeri]NVZ73448.1 LysE family transporter [Pseudomonas gingeri]NWA05572.1 LysE family transporter [Pseudomonas gingeri]BBP77482.1 threonine efflux protein [Pseudomonas sp. Ost2]